MNIFSLCHFLLLLDRETQTAHNTGSGRKIIELLLLGMWFCMNKSAVVTFVSFIRAWIDRSIEKQKDRNSVETTTSFRGNFVNSKKQERPEKEVS